MSRIEEALARAAQISPSQTAGGKQAERNVKHNQCNQDDYASKVSIGHLNEETMLVVNEPLSPAAEEYRKLKEYLVKKTKRKQFDNLIAVTSCMAGEGKSMTSINLAASLASEFDHTVLLIDADLRRPTVHKYLQLEASKGLSDCLREGIDVGDLLIKTNFGKLSVLPAGTAVANPVELFTSESMRTLFGEVKNRYSDRYVIIDTPPVLPFAETRAIAHFTDWTILVVREEKPSLAMINEAVDALGDKVLGIVYNGSRRLNKSSYYYYYSPYSE